MAWRSWDAVETVKQKSSERSPSSIQKPTGFVKRIRSWVVGGLLAARGPGGRSYRGITAGHRRPMPARASPPPRPPPTDADTCFPLLAVIANPCWRALSPLAVIANPYWCALFPLGGHHQPILARAFPPWPSPPPYAGTRFAPLRSPPAHAGTRQCPRAVTSDSSWHTLHPSAVATNRPGTVAAAAIGPVGPSGPIRNTNYPSQALGKPRVSQRRQRGPRSSRTGVEEIGSSSKRHSIGPL